MNSSLLMFPLASLSTESKNALALFASEALDSSSCWIRLDSVPSTLTPSMTAHAEDAEKAIVDEYPPGKELILRSYVFVWRNEDQK